MVSSVSSAAEKQSLVEDVPLVESGAALLSMRSSDFDAYSAYGEVIDNSLQANAKNIKIRFDYTHAARNREPINCVAFGDDGDGMPAHILHHCLQLGYSSRFNDRTGIGRFGVGATLAAINQCQKIEIYSKQMDGDWLYTYIDLEEITSTPRTMEGIPDPVVKSPPEKYADLVSKDKGTLVLWSKYDRQPDDASEIIKEFKIWTGRVFRKFIWDGINMYINGALIHAIDPLYVTTDKTAFPDDPKAYEYKTMTIQWPVSQEDLQKDSKAPKESTITIRMSLLPEEFRAKQGAGNSASARERHIDRNEGVSILRNNREVFYGHIPYWPKAAFKEIDRWWGCEISFDAILDKDFTVKNIKRGAVPIKELKQAIADKIDPTRNTAVETVQDVWKKAKSEEQETDPQEAITKSDHDAAEKIAKKSPVPGNQIDIKKDSDEETRKFVNNWLKDADEQVKAAWIAKFKSQPFSIIRESWKGSDFFEAAHLGGESVLKYNSQHTFFNEIQDIISQIEQSGENETEARKLKVMIDLLIMSFAKAEASFDENTTVNIATFMEQLRMNWGNFLTTYIRTYKDDNYDED